MAEAPKPMSPSAYNNGSEGRFDSIPMRPVGYTDEFGRRLDTDNVDKWFTYGVKPVGKEAQSGICSKTTTLYILAVAIFVIVLGIVIIVPVAIGNVQKG